MIDSRLANVVAVARAGSFTAAAAQMGLSQSTVTRSIADLEREIGYAIFTRTPRGALLTEPGRAFAERTQKLLEDARALLKRPQEIEDAYAGVLRIGVCPASLEFCLLDPVAKLLKRYPSIRLDIAGSTFERTVQQLRNGGIDVAVGYEAAFQDWADLRRHPIMSEDTAVLFVRRGHPLLDHGSSTLDDLARYNFVSPSDSRPYGSVIRGLFEDRDIDWLKRIHIIDFFPMVKRIVATTDAVGVTLKSFADRSMSFQQQFVPLDTRLPYPESAPMCCAVRGRWAVKPAVKVFMSILQSQRMAWRVERDDQAEAD